MQIQNSPTPTTILVQAGLFVAGVVTLVAALSLV